MKRIISTSLLLMTLGMTTTTAYAQECMLGEVRLFGGNFTPLGYAKADGQLLSIEGNDALFSLFGTMYGGDDRTTFGLPDMRNLYPVINAQRSNNNSGMTSSDGPNYIICIDGLYPSRPLKT